jgi:hypothetical protein
MEMSEVLKAIELSDERLAKSKEYHHKIVAKAKAELWLKIRLAKNYLKGFRATKKNLGMDMAMLMMIEADETGETDNAFSDFTLNEAECKGLEQVLKAFDGRLMLYQSIMRW